MKKNWLKILIAISATMIAGSAAFFSVTGLGVLFSGAAVAVMTMAVSLEFAKLVTATYLKQEWDNISGINKWYLTSAVVILMAITSAGIFGYLSNAFQQQNIKLEQVQREIDVWNNKIQIDTSQISLYTNQLNQLQSNNNTVLNNSTNRSSLRFATSTSKEQSKIRNKISSLNDSVVFYNTKINEIKNNNIGIEREVGGFRFVAESFGVSLNSVVKFFIILIVIVFDPLAVALIIAFNSLIVEKKKEEITKEEPVSSSDLIGEVSRVRLSENDLQKLEEVLLNPSPPNDNLKQVVKDYEDKVKREEILSEIMEKDQELGLYDPPFDNPLVKEPIISDDFTIGPNGAFEMTDEILEELQEEPTEEEIEQNFSNIKQNEENIVENKEIFPALSDEEVREMFMKEYERPGYIEEEYPGQFDEWENESVSEQLTTQEEITNTPVEEPPVETSKEDEKKK